MTRMFLSSEAGTHVSLAVLSNGALIQADIALVAIGAQPTVDWLQDSGLTLQNGIVCDEYSEAAPGIYAVGDVAALEERPVQSWRKRGV